MARIEEDAAAFEGMRQDLEAHHLSKWALVRERALVGVYDSFEKAAEEAVARFGRGPYLIRQIGAPPLTLPASVMYRLDHGPGKVRI